MRRLTRTLTLIPIGAGAISSVLYLAQGGFAGGHNRLDFVILILGLPFTLLNWPPISIGLPDIILIVWIPALLNTVLFFLFACVLSVLKKWLAAS